MSATPRFPNPKAIQSWPLSSSAAPGSEAPFSKAPLSKVPLVKRKGRGVADNPEGRFAQQIIERDEPIDGNAVPTQVHAEYPKTIITRNQSPDVPFDLSINPYRGCEHGCAYCFARPSHAYLDLSPGLDFETQLFAKLNAAERLREALNRPSYQCQSIGLGANTDPYQPIEKQYRITRELLQTLWEYRHPVSIVTKSALILRDEDILRPMAEQGLISVAISITTLDNQVKRVMEPRASSPAARLRALEQLSEWGVPVSVLAAPIVPSINDQELESILESARDAGAQGAGYVLLRLPYELKGLIETWLRTHFPTKADHVLNLLSDAREGRLNQTDFGLRQTGSGAYAKVLQQRFRLAQKRLGLNQRRVPLRTDRFRRPPQPGDQLSLF